MYIHLSTNRSGRGSIKLTQTSNATSKIIAKTSFLQKLGENRKLDITGTHSKTENNRKNKTNYTPMHFIDTCKKCTKWLLMSRIAYTVSQQLTALSINNIRAYIWSIFCLFNFCFIYRGNIPKLRPKWPFSKYGTSKPFYTTAFLWYNGYAASYKVLLFRCSW